MQALLCDIEGTTTSLSFAQDVLFPFSRREMRSFVHDHWKNPELRTVFDRLGTNSAEETTALLESWIDADRKEWALKLIQGKIWKRAFEGGEIRAHIYPDVPGKWSDWKTRGIKIYIFSSGSIEAQQLIFRYSEVGDLSPLIDGYFDTTTGPKKEPVSYRKIASAVGLNAADVLFASDVEAELDAASAAGMQTVHVLRDDPNVRSKHPRATSFADITPAGPK